MADMKRAVQGVFEPALRRVRVEFNGEIIADSVNVMLMIESVYELHYYFPIKDVKQEYLVESDFSEHSGLKGNSQHWHVQVGDRTAEHAAFTYPEQKANRPDLSGYITFDWKAMDHWYEEAEEVIGHPRNPYHRVDVIESDRHIRVEVDGVTVADTDRFYLLYETGLPARYYIPAENVKREYLVESDHHTICPYKGVASYHHVKIGDAVKENLVWYYPEPFPETLKAKGALSFYNEKVDIYVDGEKEERPRTVFA